MVNKMIIIKSFTSILYQPSRTIKIGGLLTITILLISSCNAFLEKQSKLPLATPITEWKLYDIEDITWSMDSSSFAVLGNEKDDDVFGVYMYRTSGSEKKWFHKVDISFGLAVSPDNRVVAIPIFQRILILLDQNIGDLIKEVNYYMLPSCFGMDQIRYSPDGKKIFSLDGIAAIGHEYSEIYVWDVETEQCQGTLIREEGVAVDFELSRDGKFLVLGLNRIGKNADRQVHVWNVETRKQICSFKGAEPVAFAPDGSVIAAGSIDKQEDVGLWDAKTCQPLDVIRRQERKGAINQRGPSVGFSPDGKLLAIGGNETIQIWDVANRKLMFESEKLPNAVVILAFSPNGQFLLSETPRISADDKAIITLWSVSQE